MTRLGVLRFAACSVATRVATTACACSVGFDTPGPGATTAASPTGSGLAYGHLGDAGGDCGRVLQTLLIAGCGTCADPDTGLTITMSR